MLPPGVRLAGALVWLLELKPMDLWFIAPSTFGEDGAQLYTLAFRDEADRRRGGNLCHIYSHLTWAQLRWRVFILQVREGYGRVYFKPRERNANGPLYAPDSVLYEARLDSPFR